MILFVYVIYYTITKTTENVFWKLQSTVVESVSSLYNERNTNFTVYIENFLRVRLGSE